MRKYKAALLGYYGFGNLGDELLLTACLDMLKGERVVVLSNTPDDTAKTFSVECVNRWKFGEVVKALRSSETLILGGGGLFQDVTSVKSCVWYWAVVRLAKFCGCKVLALGQSVGPLGSRLSRTLTGNALRACEAVHVRDEKSCALAEALGCKRVIKGCDLVLTLKPETLPKTNRYMLVNLRPAETLGHFTHILAPHIAGVDVVGAALSDDDANALTLAGVRKIVRVRTLHDAAELWSGASCAVGMRLHFGVLSRLFMTPLALMPYDVKVSEFARESGVPCIADEWQEPVMPLPVPEDVHDIDMMIKFAHGQTQN